MLMNVLHLKMFAFSSPEVFVLWQGWITMLSTSWRALSTFLYHGKDPVIIRQCNRGPDLLCGQAHRGIVFILFSTKKKNIFIFIYMYLNSVLVYR